MSLPRGSTPSSAPDTNERLSVLQVNSADIAGGAAGVAWNLFVSYRGRGHASRLVVGSKRSADPDVVPIRGDMADNGWVRTCHAGSRLLEPLVGRVRGVGRIQGLLDGIAQPLRWQERL